MTRLSRTVRIEAPRHRVWRVLIDIGRVAAWNPRVSAADCGPGPVGIGTVRRCELLSGGSIEEQVSRLEPEAELWFAMDRHGAVRSAEMGFLIADPDPNIDPGESDIDPDPDPGESDAIRDASTTPATTVTAVADYHLALGPIGPVIDHVTVRRLMTTMLDSSLRGLKQHIESKSKSETESETESEVPVT